MIRRNCLHIEERWVNELSEFILKEKDKYHNNWISTGKSVIEEEFEKLFSEKIGCKYSIPVSSGSAAITLAIKSLEIKKGSEIVISNYGYPAATNCLISLGYKPIFVDIDRETLCISPKLLKSKVNHNTKAVIYIENNGNVNLTSLKEIREICNDNEIPLIEDSCSSLGQEESGRTGDVSTFSFGPSKFIYGGEGGAIVTNNLKMYNSCKTLVSRLNYRMSPIIQKFIMIQLKDFDYLADSRMNTKRIYETLGLKLFPGFGAGYISNKAAKIVDFCNRQGIEVLYKYHPYQEEMEVSVDIFNTYMELPCYLNMDEESIKKVINTIRVASKL